MNQRLDEIDAEHKNLIKRHDRVYAIGMNTSNYCAYRRATLIGRRIIYKSRTLLIEQTLLIEKELGKPSRFRHYVEAKVGERLPPFKAHT